ncbi:hypothetical protein CPter91_4230 [Collimonas pratensis]|uniref:Uncharacterized protein n=1 Tax=Collimonas pratensis TaxID=279113 RepID=A0A127Q9K3_9BURK|nr:hypothetical protein CPter91_4230 [Collimonas pratensis]
MLYALSQIEKCSSSICSGFLEDFFLKMKYATVARTTAIKKYMEIQG